MTYGFNYRKIAFLVLLLIPFALAYSQTKKRKASKSTAVNTALPQSTPEDGGFSSKALGKIFTYVKENKVNIHSLMIIHDNKTVLDAYFYPFPSNFQHDIAACTKAVTSILIGVAIDKGFIKNEDELVASFFPELDSSDENFKTLTIKNLLTMTSGLECGPENENALFNQIFEQGNWPEFIFDIPFDTIPGKQYTYCNLNYQLLSEIIHRKTKLPPEAFAKKYLFNDLGITSVYWPGNARGTNYGWGDLAMKPYDLAKIGQLLLNNGKWNNKQIVSADWLKKATAMNIVFNDGNGYGYGFLINKDGSYHIDGTGGQRMQIDPLHKTIIIATGGGYNWDEKGGIGDLIAAASHYDEKMPTDSSASNNLKRLIAAAAKPSADSAAYTAVSPKQDGFYNKTMFFAQNSLNIKGANIKLDNGKLTLVITRTWDVTYNYVLGMGAQYQFYKEPGSGHLFALRGYWKTNNEFEIEFNMLSKIDKYLVDFKLGNTIQVNVKESTHNIDEALPVLIFDK
jgi:CubicO group peptidase (beta-lactamase class C family)